jgi:hypothetical protein
MAGSSGSSGSSQNQLSTNEEKIFEVRFRLASQDDISHHCNDRHIQVASMNKNIWLLKDNDLECYKIRDNSTYATALQFIKHKAAYVPITESIQDI